MNIIKEINKSTNAIWIVLPKLSVNELEDIIKVAADSYHNTGVSLVSDDIYDILVDRLKLLNPKSNMLKSTGAKIKGKKVKLPYWMGSMDKIKSDEKQLSNWQNENKGPYLISDKLDGISCLIIIDTDVKMYTRGDGEYGQNITHLLNLVNVKIPKNTSEKIALRGELIMSKNNFSKYATEFANARNMVSGVVNSKPESVNKKYAKDIDFVAYEMVEPNYSPSMQMKKMHNLGFTVVNHKIYNKLTIDNLTEILNKNRVASIYEIDGIIITNDKQYTRNTSGNPSYSIAFKGVSATADTEVIDVIWKPAKDGHIIPRIHFNKVKLSGADLEYTTGFNAKFIEDNLIGPKSIITMTRSGDTIPYIINIVKPSKKASFPTNLNYEWDDNHVNIILTDPDDNPDVIITRITKFVRDIGIENMSEGIVTRLYENGYDTIPKIMKLTKKDLLKLDGFQDKLADKLIANIKEKINQLDMLTLMVASNKFGRGFGERKIKKILEVYPDVVEEYNKKDKKKWIGKLIEIDGFDTISATKFIESLDEFQEFYNEIATIVTIKNYIVKGSTNGIFKDETIVFTGFRNKDWDTIIEINGGKKTNSVSKNTTLLVYADGEESSSKYLTAKKLGIQMMNKSVFQKKYGL